MTGQIRPAPVRKSIRVNARPDVAFEVFTARLGRWWPRGKHISPTEPDDFVIEPFEGGRWFERSADGAECDIGKVLTWDPPGRLILAWQLNARWTFDPELITEVEVRFTPDGEGVTRVDLEHRHIERMGEGAPRARDAVDGPNGWGGILEQFAVHANAARGGAGDE